MPKRYRKLNDIERLVRAKLSLARRRTALEAYANEYQAAATEAARRLNEYGSRRVPPGIVAGGNLGVYGRGAYSLGKLSRTAAGKNIGRALIKRAANMISGRGMYTGRGSYVGNSLMGSTPPQVITSAIDETGAVTVSKLEFLSEIYGPPSGDAFNVQKFELNPGLENTFPWLSQVAQNYEEYEFVQLVFSYRSTVTDIGSSTTGQCGTVIMATVYDPSSAVFTDKTAMMGYDGSMSSKTTENMVHGVECDPNKLSGSPGKYIRSFSIGSNKDLKDYDHGLFQLAIANSPTAYANTSIGELWVSYTVKLRKPKFFASRGLNVSRDVFVSNGSESVTYLFGGTPTILSGASNNIRGKLDYASGSQLLRYTFPAQFAGVVEFVLRIEGTSLNIPTITPAIQGQISEFKDIYGSGTAGDTPDFYSFAQNSTSVIMTLRYRVKPAQGGVNNSITWAPQANSTGTVTQSSMEVNEVNAGFSYSYANLGNSDKPILVDPNGQIVNI